MLFIPWLRSLKSPSRLPRTARNRNRRHALLWATEPLEDRTLLSGFAGDLDPTFGDGGLVTTDFLGSTRDFGQDVVAIQSDGKIVLVGTSIDATGRNFAVARYNSDGSLDASFGVDGKLTTDFAGSFDEANGVAIQADGRIVVAGRSGGDFALARYNADGSLDTSFDGDGKLTTDFAGFSDEAFDVAIQADGKIVVVGRSGFDFGLARYNADGSLDASFDGDGRVTTDFAAAFDRATGVAVQADGKIVVAGTSSQIATGDDFALARYNADGSLDAGFGGDGKVTTDFIGPSSDTGKTLISQTGRNLVAIQADGKIVVVGSTQSAGGTDFALARYNPDGSLDASFGDDGRVTTDFGGFGAEANAVAIQTDGKIVVAGSSGQLGTGSDFALARYNPDGSLDTSFGGDGKVTTDIFFSDFAFDVAIQADGKIVATGRTSGSFGLVRYNPDGSLDASFDGDGKLFAAGIRGRAFGLAIQADGKIVQVGNIGSADAFLPRHFAVSRYNPDGSLDTSFGVDGRVVTTDFVGAAFSVVLQADGKIVVAGHSGGDFALARYNADGSLDTGFDGDGKLTTDFAGRTAISTDFDIARGLALQADGKIVVAGFSKRSGAFDFALARYNVDGSLDTRFGGDGRVTTDFAGFSDFAFGLAIQADGKIVAAGQSFQSGTGIDFALARYIAVGPQDVIEDIISDVQALVISGALNNGQGTSLLAKLQASIQVLDSNNETAAINLLQAFVNQVTAFIDTAKLTSAEGQPLIDAANAIIDQLSGGALHVAGGAAEDRPRTQALTEERLQPILEEAVSLWTAAGADAHRLSHVDVRVADIPGSRLGVHGSSGTIWIDRDAAGYGWSTEVESQGLTVEGSGVDLLSVVTHELGHMLGFEHSVDGVMSETLTVGERHLPGSHEALLGEPAVAPDNGTLGIPMFDSNSQENSTSDESFKSGVIFSPQLLAEKSNYALENDFDAPLTDDDFDSSEPVPYLPEEDLDADSFFSVFEESLLDDLLTI